MSPSDLAWWGWLLCGMAAAFVAIRAWNSFENGKGESFPLLLAVVSGIASVICGLIGIIRFVKWVWNS